MRILNESDQVKRLRTSEASEFYVDSRRHRVRPENCSILPRWTLPFNHSSFGREDSITWAQNFQIYDKVSTIYRKTQNNRKNIQIWHFLKGYRVKGSHVADDL